MLTHKVFMWCVYGCVYGVWGVCGGGVCVGGMGVGVLCVGCWCVVCSVSVCVWRGAGVVGCVGWCFVLSFFVSNS